MRRLSWQRGFGLTLILLLTAALFTGALAETAQAAQAPVEAAETAMFVLPAFTQTDCEWDGQGNLIRETAHTLDGAPAVNSRGFARAEYTWDAQGNLLTEA